MRSTMTALVLVLLVLLLPGSACAGLITNGGFETGDFAGWTVSGAMVYYGINSGAAHSGLYGAWFGDVSGLTYIAETISTIPGETYLLTFYVAAHLSAGVAADNYAALWWGGILIDSGTDVPKSSWIQNSYLLTATTTSTEIKFGFYDPPGWWTLDDVNLTAVPEPASIVLLPLGLMVFAVRRVLSA